MFERLDKTIFDFRHKLYAHGAVAVVGGITLLLVMWWGWI